MKRFLLLIAVIALVGCANVQLQDSKVISFDSARYTERTGIKPLTVKGFNIRSTADPLTKPECPDDRCLSRGVRMPIVTPMEIGKLLQEDLNTYLNYVLLKNETSNRVINISIYKAQAYKSEVVPPAGWIPIIGLFIPDEFKIGLLLGLTISVYDSGRLLKDYQFDRQIELVDPISADSKDIYPKVIEEYRRILYSEIDREILSKIEQ